MGHRIIRSLLGLAALAAVASPIVLILLLDPRIGLMARRAAREPAPAVRTPASPAPDPAPATPSAAAPACPPCERAESLRPSVPPDRPEPPAAPPQPTPPLPEAGIVTPDVAAEREAQRRRLVGFVTHPDRVSGSAAWLDVIGLGFTQPRPADVPSYRRAALDLTEAPDRAVVVLADQPLALTLATRPSDRAGALGVESLAAFDLPEGRSDLLAGFRSAALGAARVAPILVPVRYGPESLKNFCAALRLWAGLYGLGLDRIRYTLIQNAGQIRLEGDRIHTDGTARGRVAGRRLALLCSP
ncbi:hypothetical protein [Methylobacterium nodulans]|uniref:Uncharacterized protein n=1 Tax=Methylobacterium nodulans (strain LMG 21967 / CNCM I-2342 / ORS 2060) TaxID=460265 RepID=B8IDA8_METNO|nr:hypothetical protein [Methylobacterium nodulans]ACL61274.1 conserved hypothetical protein [Methylobacterium nodulans ORS 2060]